MKIKPIIKTTFAIATLAVAGCAGTPWGDGNKQTSAAAPETEAQQAGPTQREKVLEQELARLEADRIQLEKQLIEMQLSSADAQSNAANNSSLIPPDPEPGECYAQVIVPAKFEAAIQTLETREELEDVVVVPARYEPVPETYLVKEASKKLEIVPARYEVVQESVMVKPPTTRLEVVDAVYEIVEERILVKEAITETRKVEAVYEPSVERVLVQEGYTEWRRAADILGSGGNVSAAGAAQMIQRYGDYEIVETRIEDTGELMCLVKIDDRYKEVPTQVLVEPAHTITVEIEPAEYKTVMKRVVETPATRRVVDIPPEYRTIEVTKLIQPETVREIDIPAEYDSVPVVRKVEPARETSSKIPAEYVTVKTNKKVAEERIEWRPVLCGVNMTPENVSALQSALDQAGSCRCGPGRNRCEIDGIIGQCTLQAVQRFAEQNDLSWGNNYITMDVVRALGLRFESD